MWKAIAEIVKFVIDDIIEWANGGDSKYDYTEFAKRLPAKLKSQILLEREKARLAAKKPK